MLQLRIKHRLTLFVTGISLFCFFFTCLFFYSLYSNAIQKNALDSSRAEVASVTGNVDLFLHRLSRETKLIADDANLVQFLRSPLIAGDQADTGTKIDQVLNEFVVKMSKEVSYVEIISKKPTPDFRFSTSVESIVKDFDFDQTLRALQDREFGWIFDHTGTSDLHYIYLLKIKDNVSGQVVGMVAVHLRGTVWESLLQGTEMNISLTDAEGSLIYRHGDEKVQTFFTQNGAKPLKAQEGTLQKTIEGDSYFVSYQSSEDRLFKVIVFTNMKDLLREISNVGVFIVWVGVLSFILSVLFSLLLSYRITASIRYIQQQIEFMIKGNHQEDQPITIPNIMGSRSLSNKLRIVIIYVAIVMVPMVASILIMNAQATQSIKTQTVHHHSTQLEVQAKKIDVNLDLYNQKLNYLFGEKTLNRALAQFGEGTLSKKELARTADNVVYKMEEVASGEVAVSLYDEHQQLVHRTGCLQHSIGGQLEIIKSNVQNKTIWFPSSADCGTFGIHFGKNMLALTNYEKYFFFEPLGTLILSVNEQLLQNLYAPQTQMLPSTIFIMDEKGKIISHPLKSNIGKALAADWPAGSSSKNGIWKGMANGVPTQFVYSRLESTAWILVEAIPESLLDQPIPLKSTFMWLAILLDAAVLGAGIYWFIRFLTLRIHTLNDGMSEVAGGNLGIQVDIRSRDEIQGLADGFNAMVRRLNELMNETYMQGIRRKEAELNSLQAQINPHFLYNTLESINWEAMMFTNGPNKVSEMVTALSDLLRLSINKGKEIVMFEDEINHVKNYLFIQKERYMDKFEVEWEIDPHLYAYKTLKLILQPLVENAIYHGLEMKEGIGLIVIKGEIFDDFVQLEIADNGLGMPPEQLEAVRRALKDYKSSQIDGIGIHNVHDRIQLYYGEQYGISLYSEVNVGTRIVICLPLHGPEDRFGSPNFFDQGGD